MFGEVEAILAPVTAGWQRPISALEAGAAFDMESLELANAIFRGVKCRLFAAGRQFDQSFGPRLPFCADSLRWVTNCKFGKVECFENGAPLFAMEGQFFSAGHAHIYP